MEEVTFHRFVEKDFNELKKLFNKTFNKKISKNFYKWRYLKKNRFNSFVAKIGNKIIGHVGFVEYKLNSNIIKFADKIYSRHSSMVSFEYRKKNIYNSLLKWSFSQLDKNFIIITWPNKLNNLSSKKNKNEIKFKYQLFYKKITKKKSKTEKKFKLNKLNKDNLKLLNVNNKSLINKLNIIDKNQRYFSWRYLYYNQNSNFYFQKKVNKINNTFIIGKNIKNNRKFLSILDFIGNEKYYYTILDELIAYLECSIYANKNYYLQIWSDKKNIKKINYLKKNKFKIINNIFNINILNSKYKIKSKAALINFEMGDTDVFINIGENN